MTGPQYPQQPYGQGPQFQPGPQGQSMSPSARAGLVIGVVVLVVSVVTMVFSWLLVGIAILLVGAFYAFLVFRGMPPLADIAQTTHALRSLSGPQAPGMPTPQQPQFGGPGRPGPPVTSSNPFLSVPAMPVQPPPMTGPPMSGPQSMGGFTEAMASDPSTPAEVLNKIAADAPHLRPALARNPSTYDDLLVWLGSLGDPAVDAALAQRRPQ